MMTDYCYVLCEFTGVQTDIIEVYECKEEAIMKRNELNDKMISEIKTYGNPRYYRIHLVLKSIFKKQQRLNDEM